MPLHPVMETTSHVPWAVPGRQVSQASLSIIFKRPFLSVELMKYALKRSLDTLDHALLSNVPVETLSLDAMSDNPSAISLRSCALLIWLDIVPPRIIPKFLPSS